MLKKALLIAALLAVVSLTGVNNVPPAQAACEYPHGRTIEYWAWVSNSDPNDVWCGQPPLLPNFFYYYTWTQVGEYTVECDGSVTQWGITSGSDAYGQSCTTAYNKVQYGWDCDPICE